ncbi:hypothetical protein [Paraburkholderia sp. XV]|uniref:hypothetical protein n=1 Tax=Paraburkholderia sp. XV TaxID=2831520 RepID=UPI001CD5A906|nr:hypothetical protein [Paraburkholderia sp. XV]
MLKIDIAISVFDIVAVSVWIAERLAEMGQLPSQQSSQRPRDRLLSDAVRHTGSTLPIGI